MRAAVRETVERLANGSVGRTEADIQSDVRKFLLDAPFDIGENDLLVVALEAQVEGGGRIDVEVGFAAIEVKKGLSSPRALSKAIGQLGGYVRRRTEARGQRYAGVLTDGQTWVLFHLTPEGGLSEVSRLVVRSGEDAPLLAAWLEPVLATTRQISPTPDEISRRLGADSAAVRLDLADLRALYATCRDLPEVQLKRELWARLLLSALGTNFEDSDELFVIHTYLVLTAELIAHEVLNMPIAEYVGDLRELLEGQQFDLAGLHGVVEADFFDWPVTVDAGVPVVRAIARRLSRFAWADVHHDVLKLIYQSIIDRDTRKRLGEYYTPDWLAQKIVNEQLRDPLGQRVLDPACGSGTFLFWAIRKSVEACETAGMSDREMLEHVASNIFGMDLHPVAVTLARVTYLLALGPDRIRLAERGELTIPVFLGDSLRWEQDETIRSSAGITVRTSTELELFDQELHFPEGVVEEPARFDRLVAALASKAASRKSKAVPKIGGLLKAHKVDKEQDRAAVELVFRKLCRLHDAGRDHLWSYYIRNLARPVSFAAADGQVDLLVGNPPWLAFRHMPGPLKETYRTLAEERGLWAGGGSATHQDLSDLFAARAVEQYLKPDGRFAFVMPHAALSRLQFAGFRTAHWARSADEPGTDVEFGPAEDYSRVKPAFFRVPACVVSGGRSRVPRPLRTTGVVWSGRIPRGAAGWSDVEDALTATVTATERATLSSSSLYRGRFRQGATLVPRVLIKVEEETRGPLGGPSDRIRVTSSRTAVEKAPWKSVPSLRGRVEPQFLRPTHLGASIVAFRARAPEMAVLPLIDGQLADGNDDRLDEFEGLADWWRRAEEIWEAQKGSSNRLSLRARIDYQRGVSAQTGEHAQRVVYTRSGQYLAACRIEDPHVLLEQTLYWAPVETVAEGRYLTGVLNSGSLARAIAPRQSRGQHNPRDFASTVFSIPIPLFDPTNSLHAQLAALAARAEQVVAAVELPATWQFQRARRVTREALHENGVAAELDGAVDQLFNEATAETRQQPRPEVPELLDVLSTGTQDTREQTRKQRRKQPAAPRSDARKRG